MNIYFLAVIILLLGAASFIVTWLILRFAGKRRIMAIPNERSLHDTPVPKGGGIAIVLTWYTGITILFFAGIIEKSLYFALLCGVLLSIVSLVDDIVDLRPVYRLIIQFITATVAFSILGGLRPLIIPGFDFDYNFIVYPLAVVGVVWFVNLFNFMDGVDGFASTEAIIMSMVMFAYSGNTINILLIACIGGFLYWNWPKAKIFMGDVGSTQLGFILVVLGLYFHNEYKFSILNWIMLSSPFWFDATLTLFRRWKNGERLGQAHRKHAYQRFVQAGHSHLTTDLYLIALNIIVIILILLYREYKIMQYFIPGITIIFLYIVIRVVDKKLPFK